MKCHQSLAKTFDQLAPFSELILQIVFETLTKPNTYNKRTIVCLFILSELFMQTYLSWFKHRLRLGNFSGSFKCDLLS